MLQTPPTDDQLKVLRVLQGSGSIQGADLQKRAGIREMGKLVEALQQLIDQNFIAASSRALDVSSADKEFYHVMPSAIRYVRSNLPRYSKPSSDDSE